MTRKTGKTGKAGKIGEARPAGKAKKARKAEKAGNTRKAIRIGERGDKQSKRISWEQKKNETYKLFFTQ